MELLLICAAVFPLQSTHVFCGVYVRVTVLQRKKKIMCNEYLTSIVLQGFEIYKYMESVSLERELIYLHFVLALRKLQEESKVHYTK